MCSLERKERTVEAVDEKGAEKVQATVKKLMQLNRGFSPGAGVVGPKPRPLRSQHEESDQCGHILKRSLDGVFLPEPKPTTRII